MKRKKIKDNRMQIFPKNDIYWNNIHVKQFIHRKYLRFGYGSFICQQKY